jgi:hypothetical protein
MISDEKKQFYTTEQLSEHIAETPEGFLVCYDVPVARTGSQDYKADEVPIEPRRDGTVTIQRDEAEVFDEKTIKSFEGKPVTIDHPEGMVTPENWKELAHGFLQNVRRGVREQADLLLADVVITTKKAIELVKNGLRQVSCGYDAEYEQIKEGLGRQRDIIGNHVALVFRGRAGPRCAIGDKECTHCGKCKNLQEDNEDMKLKKMVRDFLKTLDEVLPDDEEEKKEKEQNKDTEAAKAEELKALDKKAKDELSEEEKKEQEAKDAEAAKVEELKVLDKKTKDQEETGNQGIAELAKQLADLAGTVSTLQKAIEALVLSDKEVHANIDKKAKDAEEEEEEEEEATEVKDINTVWSDVAYKVDLLAPEIMVKKPMKDSIKVIKDIKLRALKSALTTDSDLRKIVKMENIGRLTGDALDMAFDAASEVIRIKNNKIVHDSIREKTVDGFSEIQKIQRKNREFWKK